MKTITILLVTTFCLTNVFAEEKELISTFEKSTCGWKVKKGGGSKIGDGEIKLDTTNFKNGNSSLLMTGAFKKGENYVSIIKDFGKNAKINGIKFWIKTPNQNKIALRAKDAKNQTHHIRVYFPPSKLKDWQEVVVKDFSQEANKKTYSCWGGPKDGKVYLPIKRIYIILPNKSKDPKIWIDDLKVISEN